MSKLYYGNGTCTIEGSNVMGLEINYNGNITIDDKTPTGFALMAGDSKILIFPVGEGFLNELFDYEGEMKIVSARVVDNLGKIIPTTIHRVMDYSELLTSNAEDLTVNSEDLNSTYHYGRKPTKTTIVHKIISNRHTSNNRSTLYLDNGELYNGYFHVHLIDGAAMTGAEHSDDSQDLYIKQMKDDKIIDKLIPTRNTSLVSPSWKLHKETKSNMKYRKAKKTSGTSSTGGY